MAFIKAVNAGGSEFNYTIRKRNVNMFWFIFIKKLCKFC